MYVLVRMCAISAQQNDGTMASEKPFWSAEKKTTTIKAAKNNHHALSPNENEIILIAQHKYLEVWIWLYHSCKTDFFSLFFRCRWCHRCRHFVPSSSAAAAHLYNMFILFVCGWCAFVCTRAQLLFVRFFPVARSLSHYYLSLEGFSPVGCLMGFVFGLDGFWNTSLYAHRHWGWGCSSRTQSDRELNNTLFNPAYVWQRYSVHQYTYHFIFAAKHSHTPHTTAAAEKKNNDKLKLWFKLN